MKSIVDILLESDYVGNPVEAKLALVMKPHEAAMLSDWQKRAVVELAMTLGSERKPAKLRFPPQRGNPVGSDDVTVTRYGEDSPYGIFTTAKALAEHGETGRGWSDTNYKFIGQLPCGCVYINPCKDLASPYHFSNMMARPNSNGDNYVYGYFSAFDTHYTGTRTPYDKFGLDQKPYDPFDL